MGAAEMSRVPNGILSDSSSVLTAPDEAGKTRGGARKRRPGRLRR